MPAYLSTRAAIRAVTLADAAARHADLVLDFYNTRISSGRKMRNHVRPLEALGYSNTPEKAA
jgi:hypothetical protein